jgi:carbamate kinase
MLLVLALGGNALLRRGEPLEAEVQRRNLLDATAQALAPIARKHRVVVTHGNGPQVGLLALQAAAYKDVAPYPLDILGAETEGMIGYLIEQSLANELRDREIATLLTQVEVEPSDPAFARPTKPIGPVYGEAAARELAARSSWTIVPDGSGFRRAVPSPIPRRIREINVIKLLIRAGVIVICAGGGGIPVMRTPDGGVCGVEAVIDKDLSAALLAEQIGADALLLLTDVPAVWTKWPRGRAYRPNDGQGAPPNELLAGLHGSKGRCRVPFCRTHRRDGRDRSNEGCGGDPKWHGRHDCASRGLDRIAFQLMKRSSPAANHPASAWQSS